MPHKRTTIKHHCEYCGQEFIPLSRARFCSKSCRYALPRPWERPFEDRFWEKVNKTEGCWYWTGATHGGYGEINIRGKIRTASRVAWELTFGPIPDGLFVCHHCDTPRCVNPAHLFLGTNLDNTHDRIAKRRGNARLNQEIVRKIRQMAIDGYPKTHIAKHFGIGNSTVHHVLKRDTWGHVE